ncbi:unnamed protein product [Allacma fusca]|uniref:RRM domain-containing protein n=1 Tax=Allacma fusca TaxID=39272 RepID=A0A8J2NJP6_9HEXA|nr:unnamed protein product [Allacma fusca]
MNKSQLRSQGGPRVSVKDRVGLPKRLNKGKIQVKLASRLGLPVKSRVGVGKGKGGGVADARHKILLNRVSKGRVGGVGDARAKIEAKRGQKKVLGPKGNANIKILRITANLASSGRQGNLNTGRGSGLTTGRPGGLTTGRPGGLTTGRPGGLTTGRPGGLTTGRPGGLTTGRPGGLTTGRSGGLTTGRPGGLTTGRSGGLTSRGSSFSTSGGYQRDPVSHGFFANMDQDPFPKASQLRVSVPSSRPIPSNRMDPGESLFLTRTVQNYQASAASSSSSRSWSSSVAKVAPSFSRNSGPYGAEDMDMDEDSPPRIRISNSLQSRLDSHEESPRYRLLVSNLQPTVTTEDIVELFSDINTPISAQITSSGHAEVVYSKKSDCLKAVEAYHNRLLDGSPMRVVLENSSTTLKSAGGATMKLPKASSSVKIQPDISAIHKVLFNPSSGNSTRGLFKGGQ